MKQKSLNNKYLINIIIWGALWGIFESTVGYVLHLFSFGYSWVIWYPAACFFMSKVYLNTRSLPSVFLTAVLCASIKLSCLFLPGRIDKVINPAVSIVFEAFAAVIAILAVTKLQSVRKSSKAFALIIGMNISWRILYSLYLLFLVPEWIKDISVISTAKKSIDFFIIQNAVTSLIIFACYKNRRYWLYPLRELERKLLSPLSSLQKKTLSRLVTATAVLLIFVSICLQILL